MKLSVFAVLNKKQLLHTIVVTEVLFCCLFFCCKNILNKAVSTISETEHEKIVYLTFDDGPSPVTLQILDILKEHDIKATFFVVGSNVDSYPDIVRRIAEEGHSIGVHSDTHDYKAIYQSEEAFFNDFAALADKIKAITQRECKLYRFPGGSSNTMFKKYSNSADLLSSIQEELLAREITYVDWNVSAEDAVGYKKSPQTIASSVIKQVNSQYPAVVLMHDTIAQQTTADALEQIISTLQKQEFAFAALSENVSCRHNIDAYR